MTQAPLTVVADSFTRTYGAANPAFTASYLGLVNGNTAATAVAGAPVLSTTAAKFYPWGLYDISITAGTLSSANYSITLLVPGTLWITQAPLTVAATSITVGQGGVIPALTYTITGFVNGESTSVVSGAPAETTTAVTGSNPGTYPITITAGSLSALDYNFVFVNGTVTITTAAAAKPEFSVGASAHSSVQIVTIADATPGATIYYTVNGETPTTASSKYTQAISIATTETIKAIAVAPKYGQSATAAATFTVE